METFERNLKAIEAKDKPLAERLRDPAIEGVPIERTRSGDSTFCHGGRHFHSTYDPWKEAAAQAREILKKKSDWVMLFGLGCGYLLMTLVKEGRKKIVVYEPCLEILKGVLNGVDLSSELGMEDVFVHNDVNRVVERVRENVEGIDDIVSYQSLPYRQAFPEELNDYSNRVRNAHTTNSIGISTQVVSSRMWNENYFSNIKSFVKYPPVDALRGAFKGMPLVIAGAGPSLKKNGHLLKGLKGKAMIIAAVTAYKPLLSHGVIPDFVIAAEKVDLPEYFTYGLEDKETRLILGDVSHPAMYGRDVKGKFVYYNFFHRLSVEQARFFGSDYFPSSGGSVTTSAFEIGLMFGCDPVIFVGQDLAYGNDGRTHAPGGVYVDQKTRIDSGAGKVSIEEDYISQKMTAEKAKNTFELLWLKGHDGGPVASRYDWVTFHQWFEKKMRDLKEGGCATRVINATEGGAYIEGMEHITLREAIEGHATANHPFEELIREREAERAGVDMDGLTGSLKKMEASMRLINRLSGEIVRETGALRKAFDQGGVRLEFASKVKKIKRIEERLFDQTKDAVFIWDILARHTYRLKEYLREDESSDSSSQFGKDLDATAESYRNIRDASVSLLPLIRRALEDVGEAASRGAGALGMAVGSDYGARTGCEKENCCGQCRH